MINRDFYTQDLPQNAIPKTYWKSLELENDSFVQQLKTLEVELDRQGNEIKSLKDEVRRLERLTYVKSTERS